MRSVPCVAALLCTTLLFACDDGSKEPAPAAEPAAEPAEEAAAPEPPKPEEKKLEIPWDAGAVKDHLRGGATLVYKQTGKNAKGKDVEDDFKCEVKKSSGTEIGTVCDGVNHPSEDKGATQVAMQEWSQYSPFFVVSKPEENLVAREDLTVPAGTFDCVQVELKGFFGNHYTAWMIADEPGIYAKVIKHANATVEDDKTELTFELAEITMGGG